MDDRLTLTRLQLNGNSSCRERERERERKKGEEENNESLLAKLLPDMTAQSHYNPSDREAVQAQLQVDILRHCLSNSLAGNKIQQFA